MTMAHVLPLSQHSPFTVSAGRELASRSSRSPASASSNDTVRRHHPRSVSPRSFSSTASKCSPHMSSDSAQGSACLLVGPTTSTSSLNPAKISPAVSHRERHFEAERELLASSAYTGNSPSRLLDPHGSVCLSLVDLTQSNRRQTASNKSSLESSPGAPPPEHDFDNDSSKSEYHDCAPGLPISDDADSRDVQRLLQQEAPFRRWVSKLRRKRHKSPLHVSLRTERWTLDDFDKAPLPLPPLSPRINRQVGGHHKSDSQNSSLRFITSIRSATATVASASIATISRRASKWRRGQQRSSVISASEPRPSVDSARSMIDEAAKQRSRKRREKLEELIRTEESYVADIKALSNVLQPVCFSVVSLTTGLSGLFHDTGPSGNKHEFRETRRAESHRRHSQSAR